MKKFDYENFLLSIEETKTTYIDYENEIIDFLKKYLQTDMISGTGQKGDKGIDGVYVVPGANKISLFQFKMGKPSNSMDYDGIQSIRHKMIDFLKDINNVQHKDINLSKAATLVHQGKVKEIDLFIFTTKTFTRNIDYGVNNKFDENIKINENSIKTSTFYFDKNGFFEMAHYLKTNKVFDENIKGRSLDFELKEGNYIEHLPNEGYTVKVNARELYEKVYSIIQSKHQLVALTHKNVRDFLGTKKDDKEDLEDISSGIIKTLTSDDEGRDLYAYHMGMVVLCEDMIIKNNKLTVVSPSFVNGAQSLGSLINIVDINKINKEATFTIRFVKTQLTSKKSKEFADKIVIRTNSSNPITWQMKYAFDPKQSFIARLFEERGYFYNYRAAEKEQKENLKLEVKEISGLFHFSETQDISKFSIGKDVLPDDIAAAIYVVDFNEEERYKIPRSQKNKFRYSSNLSKDYYKIFYKNGELRSFLDYFLPYATHKLFLKSMEDIFTNGTAVIDPSKKLFKLTFNEARKIQWLLFVDFLDKNKISSVDSLLKTWNNFSNKYDDLKKMIRTYLKDIAEDFEDSSSKRTTVKKRLIDKKVTNLADIAR